MLLSEITKKLMNPKFSIKTLFIVKEIPYPPIGGVCLRNWQNINIMTKHGEVAVLALDRKESDVKELPNVNAFYYHQLDNSNSISPVNKDQNDLQNSLIDDLSCKYVDDNCDHQAIESLKSIMIDFKPDLVIIEQLWLFRYMEIVKSYPCKIILDEHNIEADLLKQREGINISELELSVIERIEKEAIAQCDQVWLCSNSDRQLLIKKYGNFNHTYLVPNGIDVNSYNFSNNPNKSSQNKIIYSGYFPYEPNQIAAKLLIEKIFPELQQQYPDATLMLVGYNPSEFMLGAARKNNSIIVTGTVPDVKPYFYQASAMVVPLLQGGGTRLKILEAFASGCPVISTTKGAEGLQAQDGEHLLLRDSISDIIEGVNAVWSDIHLSQNLTQSAYNLVKTTYSWQAVAQNIEDAIKQLFV
jgi:glycosyltransferase involved in cell wall biosynthesis